MKSVKKMMIGIMAAALMVTGFAGCKRTAPQRNLTDLFRNLPNPNRRGYCGYDRKGYGTIKIRFFKKQAPKAVENFITHAKRRVLIM